MSLFFRSSGLFAMVALSFVAACGTGDGTADGPGSALEADAAGGDGGQINPDAVKTGGDDATYWDSSATASTCSSAADCDDGLACTEDACAPNGQCAWVLAAGKCLINSVCVDDGGAKPSNGCFVCDPTSPHKWTAAPEASVCGDGEPCTGDGECTAGKCITAPLKCDDDDPCTIDSCKLGKGCLYEAGGTAACDDGNPCTSDDACTDGACVGTPDYCDDNNLCTDDSCVITTGEGKGGQLGCKHTNNSDGCEDGDLCTDSDTCADGKCASGGATNCDDGNACTIDLCEDFAGCGHLPTKNPCCQGKVSICDDGDPCTTDLCDPKTSKCSQKPSTAVCDDSNKCTQKDACADGKCAGVANKCDDKNSCTKDACDPAKGCVHSPGNTGGECDDGNPCTKSDVCGAGVCKGSGQCACTPKFSTVASKLNVVEIGKGGQPGEGMNIDGDKSTCAPKSNCKDGIDNAVGSLAGIANPQLKPAIEKGSVMLVVEFGAFKQGPIELAVHQAELHSSNASCDHMKAVCKYSAAMSLIDAVSCKPKVKLAGTLTGDKIKAGGKGTVFPFSLPIQPGVTLDIKIFDVQIEGTVKVTDGKLVSFVGLLGGAIPKKSLADAIKALPDDGLPLPKDTIIGIIDSTVAQDQDVDGDGTMDASSIALKIGGIGAVLVDAK